MRSRLADSLRARRPRSLRIHAVLYISTQSRNVFSNGFLNMAHSAHRNEVCNHAQSRSSRRQRPFSGRFGYLSRLHSRPFPRPLFSSSRDLPFSFFLHRPCASEPTMPSVASSAPCPSLIDATFDTSTSARYFAPLTFATRIKLAP